MPRIGVNGVELFYQLSDDGEIPLVFVHGGWASHRSWEFVAQRMGDSFRMLTYDRRGHSQSERREGQGSVWEDVADLGSLIEYFDLSPAWVVGLSSGAAIVLRLASRRPDLFSGLIAHEPALFSLLADDPSTAPLLAEVLTTVATVVARVESDDPAAAAEMFFEKIVGPGSWAQLPQLFQEGVIENAPTFLDDVGDPDALSFNVGALSSFERPTLLTRGDQSPPLFAPIVSKLSGVLPNVEVITLAGTGHIPQITHSDAYAGVISDFIAESSRVSRKDAVIV